MAKTFGQALRELRRSKGVSQRDLAEKVGVDFSYISKLENDRHPPPAADTIVKICKALGVAPDELLASTGKMPTNLKDSLSTVSFQAVLILSLCVHCLTMKIPCQGIIRIIVCTPGFKSYPLITRYPLLQTKALLAFLFILPLSSFIFVLSPVA